MAAGTSVEASTTPTWNGYAEQFQGFYEILLKELEEVYGKFAVSEFVRILAGASQTVESRAKCFAEHSVKIPSGVRDVNTAPVFLLSYAVNLCSESIIGTREEKNRCKLLNGKCEIISQEVREYRDKISDCMGGGEDLPVATFIEVASTILKASSSLFTTESKEEQIARVKREYDVGAAVARSLAAEIDTRFG